MSNLIGAAILMSSLLSSQVPDRLMGDWIGALEIADKQIPIQLHFWADKEHVLATIDIPAEGIEGKVLDSFTIDSNHIRFEMETESGTYKFEGERKEDRIAGSYNRKDMEGTFELIQLGNVDPKTYEQYFGIYKLDDRFIYIRTWDELGKNRLTYFDNFGDIGALYPRTDGTFFSGPAILIAVPSRLQVSFVNKAGTPELVWQKNGLPKKSATRQNLHKEEKVTFQNGAVKLSGTLVSPSTSGPHPAIVLVHGSGPVTRDFFGPIAYDFARRGISVLSYDKRGIGGSEGNWLEADFQDLAGDALAAVALLKDRKDIDPKRIGLWGISQGGWIAPLAASKSKDVGFIIVVSAPAVTPAQQEIMLTEEELRLQGTPEKQIQLTLDKIESDIGRLRLEEVKKELEVEVKKLKGQGNQELLFTSSLENPQFLLFYRNIMDFDPIPVLQKVTCPVLAVYGELDRTVPVKGNKDVLEAILKTAGNKNVTIELFPKGNHALLDSETGSKHEFPYLKRFVPGFFDRMSDWILKQGR